MCCESDRTPDEGALKYVYAVNGKKYNVKSRLTGNDDVTMTSLFWCQFWVEALLSCSNGG